MDRTLGIGIGAYANISLKDDHSLINIKWILRKSQKSICWNMDMNLI